MIPARCRFGPGDAHQSTGLGAILSRPVLPSRRAPCRWRQPVRLDRIGAVWTVSRPSLAAATAPHPHGGTGPISVGHAGNSGCRSSLQDQSTRRGIAAAHEADREAGHDRRQRRSWEPRA